jgi:isocitrate dehydrogenase (NAD+)
VTLIRGDGIGPEVVAATQTVVDATGVAIDWTVVDAGVDVMETYGTLLPDHVLESIHKTKVAIKGPITTPVGSGTHLRGISTHSMRSLYPDRIDTM